MDAKVQVIHSLVNKDSARIEMPAWFQGAKGWGSLAHPNVYVADSVQKYPEGTRFVEGDRIFRYIKYIGQRNASDGWIYSSTQETDLEMGMGRFLFNNGFPVTYASTYTYGLIDTDIVEVDTLTKAIEQVTDFYSGGIVTGYSATNRFFTRRIVAHDYAANKVVGGSAKSDVGTLTVDQDLVSTFSGMAVSLTTNYWKRAVWQWEDGDSLYGHTVGASMVNDTPFGYYSWVQTRGWMGAGHIGTDFAGLVERETIYGLRADGSYGPSLNNTGIAQEGYPTIGFAFADARAEAGTGDDNLFPLIWIDIGID